MFFKPLSLLKLWLKVDRPADLTLVCCHGFSRSYTLTLQQTLSIHELTYGKNKAEVREKTINSMSWDHHLTGSHLFSFHNIFFSLSRLILHRHRLSYNMF
jgi:hypothetical protein